MSETRVLNIAVWEGSLRKGSYNAALARTLRELAPEDMALKPLPSIGEFPHYNADVQAMGFPEVVSRTGDAIRAADGVIIVTPEYNYSVPGVLKNAIDWVSRLKDQPFANKPILIQSASIGIFGGARAQYQLRQSLVFLNAIPFNTPEVMVGKAQDKFNAQGELTDQATRDFLPKHLALFAAFIRKVSR